MKKRLFLGLASGVKHRFKFLFVRGRKSDKESLKNYLERRYSGRAILTKNGRSALALALKAYLEPGDGVLINGFTCYAVFEAVKAAGLKPVFADIQEADLNFSTKTLMSALQRAQEANIRVTGVIVQNSLGHPVKMDELEKFASKHQLVIIEDLAHSAGVDYPDGREAGTVGAAVAFSFGKEKSVDTTSGGAVVLRHPCKYAIRAPGKKPRICDTLQARWYPTLGWICRGLSRVHLGGPLMRLFLKLRFVERSADNRLDLERGIAAFEAKLALAQLKSLHHEPPIREFFLVREREKALSELRENGYFLDGFWYERPVSPERYYKRVHFPEKDCPVATEVSQRILNLPSYFGADELKKAREIIRRYA